jgi:class 3 adenylate cyclase
MKIASEPGCELWASEQIGLPSRAGLHTGEIEIRGRDIGGIAVHAASRVMARCSKRPGNSDELQQC